MATSVVCSLAALAAWRHRTPSGVQLGYSRRNAPPSTPPPTRATIPGMEQTFDLPMQFRPSPGGMRFMVQRGEPGGKHTTVAAADDVTTARAAYEARCARLPDEHLMLVQGGRIIAQREPARTSPPAP